MWPVSKDQVEHKFPRFRRLLEKMSQFPENRKLQNFIHGHDMCCIEILVVSNFDPPSKCRKRMGNSGSLSVENKWPVNWASIALLFMYGKRSFNYFEQGVMLTRGYW